MSHAGTPPLLTVRCPECGAARGSSCKGTAMHAARRAELAKAQKAHARSEERKSEVRSLTPEQREAVANFKCPTCKMPPGKLAREVHRSSGFDPSSPMPLWTSQPLLRQQMKKRCMHAVGPYDLQNPERLGKRPPTYSALAGCPPTANSGLTVRKQRPCGPSSCRFTCAT